MLFALLFVATVFLSYTNGANDNFKGVATLFGSGTTHYRRAIWWATLTTFAGSICAIFFAQQLVHSFSGKGLVPDSISTAPDFLIAVAFGAGATVLLATLTGFPISTTHALTGALVGVGLRAVGWQVNFNELGTAFVLPLLLSPLIAVVLSATCYSIFHAVRVRLGITEETCLCVDTVVEDPVLSGAARAATASGTPALAVTVAKNEVCVSTYKGSVLGVTCQPLVNVAHFLSAGAVSFARGLNDTPKMLALMLVIQGMNIVHGMLAVALGMALGGLLNARKVSETMSKKITPMNSGQGFTANFVTALLVLFASKIGVPVSTTHVSVGSIFGMGLITRKANYKVVGQIAMSWILTLPLAAVLGALTHFIITAV